MHSHCRQPRNCNSVSKLPINLYGNKQFQPISILNSLMAIFAFNISQINSQSTRPHIKVSMNGITNSWLYDTGAAISLIPLSEFRKIHPDLRPVRLRPQVNLTTASSSVMNVTGLYHLKLSINNRSIVHPVYVCENAAQSILGIDAIRKFGLVYSPSKHSFSFEQSASVSSLSSPPPPLSSV